MTNVLQFPTEARRPSLAQLLDMTHTMLSLAQAGEWEAALELQLSRREKLEAFFAIKPAPEPKQEIVDAIHAMLACDAQLTECLQASREAVMHDIKQLNMNRHAVGAYAST